jgi:HD-like signal output (HDOD) protein
VTDVMMAGSRAFNQIIERIKDVPSLPEVVREVIQLVDDPGSDAKQLHDIVVKDQAMAVKMLRLVNSPYFGLKAPMQDLEKAITILGFKTIRSIALSITVIDMFKEQNACFDMKAFWAHSAVSASLCRLTAEKARVCEPELAFIIGLLKDMGKVILVENAPEETRSIITLAKEKKWSFHQASREIIGCDDAEIAAWLCAHWRLGNEIVSAINDQYSYHLSTDHKKVAMCQFCQFICAQKHIRAPGDYDTPALTPTELKNLGLDLAALKHVLMVANDEVKKALELLALLQH